MPYRPETRIIRHGIADLRPQSPDYDYEGWKQIGRDYLKQQEDKYRETNDLYDLQTEQANEMNKVLEGTSGADYEYLQRSIVASRDQLKSLYKGKTLRETRSPEFQTQLYNIYQGLGNKKNSINEWHNQVKAANQIAGSTPSVKKKEWSDYINAQAGLPPDQRDKNLVNKVNTDNLFFNAYDYVSAQLAAEKLASEQVEQQQSDLILNYNASYRPSLGKFKKQEGKFSAGEFEYNPADELIDRIMLGDKRMTNAMTGMLPPDQAAALQGTGNSTALAASAREQAKKFIATVAQQQGYGYDLGKSQIRVNPDVYNRNKTTTYDKKKAEENQIVTEIQKRLLSADPRAFNDFLSKDFWQSFDYEIGANGKPNKIIGTYLMKKGPRRMVPVTEEIDIDPDDIGSVQQAINRIRASENKNKQSITVKPLQKPEAKKGGWADDL